MAQIAFITGASSGIGAACARIAQIAEVLVLATHQASGSLVYRS